MKKKIFSCMFIIFVIICSIFLVKYFKYKKSFKYTVDKISDENFFLLMQNNKYGVINKNGGIVIDPIYDVVEIPNPSRPLFICKSYIDEKNQNCNVQVCDDSKNQLLSKFNNVEAIKLKKVEKNGYYEKSVLKYELNNKYGLIDFNGNKITDAVYDSIEGFEYKEGLLLTKKSNKYGIINILGATVLKEKYDEIICDAYYTTEDKYQKSGYIVGIKTDKGIRYGYINCEGKQLLENNFNEIYRINDKIDDSIFLVAFQDGRAGVYKNSKKIINNNYEDITYNFETDLIMLKKNSKQGVSKLNGELIIPIEYDNIFFTSKYINAQKSDHTDIFDKSGQKEDNSDIISKQDVSNGRYIIIGTSAGEYKIINNNKVVESNYSYIQYLFDDYFYANKDSKNGIIDSNGNVKIDFKYSVIQKLNNSSILQLIDDDGNTILLNNKLQELVTLKEPNIFFLDNYIKVQSKNDILYFDYNGELLNNTQIYNNNKLFAVKINAKWGFQDKNGNIVIEPIYDMVTEFNKQGYAGIKQNEKWGVINSEGTIVKEPEYNLDKIVEPSFIGEYYKYDLGYEEPYYTK